MAHPSILRAKLLTPRIAGAIFGLLLLCCHATADGIHPLLPADVTMNPEAGRSGLLVVKFRLADSEALPMVVDTGAPGMLLDKSLISKLGQRLDTKTVHTFDAQVEGGIYPAPKIYLGDVQLMTGSNVFVGDLAKLSVHLKPPIMGIMGMDCLRHYCLQLDFASGTVRFLDPAHLNTAGLGKSYPLEFNPDFYRYGVPLIQHVGLLGGTATNTVIDTGNNSDGMAQGRAIRQDAKGSYSGGLIKRTKHFLAVEGWVDHPVGSLKCVWDGNTYTNIAVSRGPRDFPNWIGFRFMARHLVTFDFPNATMYLKQTSSGPLAETGKKGDAAKTTEAAAALPLPKR